MPQHRRGALRLYHLLKNMRCDLRGNQSGTSSALHSAFVSRSYDGLTDQHHSHLKATSSNTITCDGFQSPPPFTVPLSVNKTGVSHISRQSLPFLADAVHVHTQPIHLSSPFRRQISAELLAIVKELHAGTNESTSAIEMDDLVYGKLCKLSQGISPDILGLLVLQARPSVHLLMAITRWAVRQSLWYHSFGMYMRVVLYMSKQNNLASVRESIKEIMGIALSSGCTFSRTGVIHVGHQLNAIGLPELTVQLVEALTAKGFVLGEKEYGIHMTALTKLKDLPGAVVLLKKIEETEAGPNNFHYNSFLKLCGEMRKKDLMERTVLKMARRGIRPNVYTCSILIQAYGLLGETHTAVAVANEIRELGVRFNFQVYGALINAHMMNSNVDGAKKVYMEAISNTDLPRDVEFYKLLLIYHSNPLNAEKLLESHQEMVDAGFKQPASLYDNLVVRLRRAGEVERMQMMLRTMQLSGIRPVTENRRFRDVREGEEVSLVDVEMPRFKDNVVVGHCMQAIAVRDLSKLSDIVTNLLAQRMEIPPPVYMYLLVQWQKCRGNSENFCLLGVLDSCKIEVHDVVKLLLDETQSEDDIWPAVQGMLQSFFKIWKGVPAQFFNCVISLLCANNLHSRAARLWEASRNLLLTYPAISGLKLVDVKYELDLHSCSISTGKLIACVELRRISKVADIENERLVIVVTGKGNRSPVVGQSRLKDSIETMLQSMGSPFRMSSRNPGCFHSRVGDVKEWLREPRVMDALTGHADGHAAMDTYGERQLKKLIK